MIELKNAYTKDIVRTIKKNKKRFLSILIITALGITVLTGIYAACQDMYLSSDNFYDEQNLFDIRILSTLGLTQEDVEALSGIDGVEVVDGGYSETVHTEISGNRKSAELTSISPKGLNEPYVLEGRLPSVSGEIAVTQKYLDESGKAIGDSITIEEKLDDNADEAEAESEPVEPIDEALASDDDDSALDIDWDADVEIEEEQETPNFTKTKFTVTGVVLDPMDISNTNGATSFRSTSTTDYTFFIPYADIDSDVYTVVYITLAGLKEMACYSDEYVQAVQQAINAIESTIKTQREQARYNDVMIEAQDKITDAETTMEEKFADVDQQFAEAWEEIDQSNKDLAEGAATLAAEEADAARQIADARVELESAQEQLHYAGIALAEGEVQLEAAKTELDKQAALLAEGRQQLEAGKQQLEAERQAAEAGFAAAEQQFNNLQNQLDASRVALENEILQLKGIFGAAWPEAEWDALVNKAALLTAGGADDAAVWSGTATERTALFNALQTALNNLKSALQQQVSQTQADLSTTNQAATALEVQVTALAQQVTSLQATLTQKQEALATAQTLFDTESGALANLTSGTTEYDAQLIVVNNAQAALSLATAEVDSAQIALDAENSTLAGLTSAYDAKANEAAQHTNAIAQLNAQITGLQGLEDAGVQAALGLGKINGGQQALSGERSAYEVQKAYALQQLAQAETLLATEEAQLVAGEKQIAEAYEILASKKEELEMGKAAVADGRAQLAEGEATLNEKERDAKVEIGDAWAEIEDGRAKLEDGEAELVENEQTYQEKRAEAEEKIADAWAELDDIDMTKWYVQDRTSLDSYSSFKTDISSIQSIGDAFPVVFLAVAILISLTTMTRMVEEERGLIGTYKALGFSNGSIYRKYLLYAFAACLAGGVLGDLLGFIALPKFLIVILGELYILPHIALSFDLIYGIGGILLFMVGIIGATYLVCRSELAQTPANLMRPKAPRAGSRVFLEHIPAVWNRLGFLNKVTMRNLFRYKKRLFMTVLGIAGCTALLVAGFAIRDTVTQLMPKQYEDIYMYDLMLVSTADDNEELLQGISSEEDIDSYLNLQISSVKVLNASGDFENVQMMVIPTGASIKDYVQLKNEKDILVQPGNSGILITQNAADLLKLEQDGTVVLQNLELEQHEATVAGVVENYLGNTVYITQEYYEQMFGNYEPNGALVMLSANGTDPIAYAEQFSQEDYIMSSVSTAGLKADFATSFSLINSVVYLIIVLAAGLAFVVLFTLSTTNISERVRELATIKVLGFFDGEVHQYVNKETLILTAIGILIGLPIGRLISGFLTTALQMPSIYFAVAVSPISYVFAAAIAFCFALFVNLITNRTLNDIDMVEALKSVE